MKPLPYPLADGKCHGLIARSGDHRCHRACGHHIVDLYIKALQQAADGRCHRTVLHLYVIIQLGPVVLELRHGHAVDHLLVGLGRNIPAVIKDLHPV